MPTSCRIARLGALVLLLSTVPAEAVYTAEYAGSASSSANAVSKHDWPPFEVTSDHPADMHFSAPNSSTAVTGSTILGANAGNGTAFSSASFMATAGGLHIATVASATGSGNGVFGWGSSGGSSSQASAVAYDAFVVSTSSYAPGAILTVSASLSMTGSVGAMGFRSPSGSDGSYDALASWQAEVQVYNSTMLFPVNERASSSCWDGPSTGMGCGGAGFSTLDLTFTVANGQPTDLAILGQVRARAVAGAQHEALAGADAWSDLGHTIAWGGIESVVDEAGNPIGIFTAFSQTTGFDYRNAYVSAVPEPRSWLLLMVGVLAVLFRATRSTASRERMDA
jgi:hypothetical protein